MKRLIAIILSCTLVLSSCTIEDSSNDIQDTGIDDNELIATDLNEVSFNELNDPELHRYLEDAIYADLVDDLDSIEYFVENVETKYVSEEYLDELSFNSQENIYFGHNLAEIENLMQGAKYMFTLDEDGQTIVTSYEAYDDTYNQMVRNIAVGSGVIIFCVTISFVTAGAGAPAAITAIFAASAKTGTIVALSSGVLSGAAAGIVDGIQTGDMKHAIDEAAQAASEGFMWGAIGGAFAGGIGEGMALFGAARNGLTMSEAAIIQQESRYPLSLIKQFRNVDEYKVYQNAGLRTATVSNRTALVRDIDLRYQSELGGKIVTNLERMQNGMAPIESLSGRAYELHHIGQRADGTLAILTSSEHQGNAAFLNTIGRASEIDRNAFSSIRSQFWKDFAAMVG